MNLRLIILEALLLIEKEETAGNIIKQVLDKYDHLDKQERSFLKRVLEGTIERRIELDYIIDSRSRTEVKKMKPLIRNVLRMSVYQLKYMDSVPPSAVCNEAVKLVNRKGMAGLKGFVNGVLRTLVKDIGRIPYPDENTPRGMSIKYSCPMWLVDLFISEQGPDKAGAILDSSIKERDLYVRINLSKTDKAGLTGKLKDEGIECEDAPYLPYALILKDVDSLSRTKAFGEGLFAVQDIGSMLVTEVSDVKEGNRVFDVCASPGGKSMHVLDKLNGTGRLYSFDLSENKLEKIRENAERMGFSNLDIIAADAAVFNEEYEEKADILIADLPCSGLGVMGRKNDIKYNVSPDKLNSLVSLQRDILKNVTRYLKPGGTLIFSTCTIHKAENEDNFKWIGDNLPLKAESLDPYLPDALKCETSAAGYIQLIPGIHASDGFFISRFKRI